MPEQTEMDVPARAVPVLVNNRLRIRLADLPGTTAEQLRAQFAHKNPQHYKQKKMGFKAWKEPAVINTWWDDGGWLTLPRGGMRRVRGVLSKAGLTWRVSDRRTEGSAALAGMTEPLPPVAIELWEHQARIVESVLKTENCVVRAATGSGKTLALLAAASRANLPTLIMVWEQGLMRQWLEVLEQQMGLSGDDVGIIGGGKFRLRPVTVGMQQSLNAMKADKWDLVDQTFGFVGVDEISKFAAATFMKTIDRFSARYRVGVGATDKRKDGKEFLIRDMFGGIAVEVPTGEMVKKGIVHDVEVRVVPSDFQAPWYQEARDAAREKKKDAAGKVIVPSFNRLLDEMLAAGRRNQVVAEAIAECAADGQVLVFAHRRAHCRRLDAVAAGMGFRSGLMTGEDDEEYAATVIGLRSGDRRVGVGTFKKIGMGLDLPSVSSGVVATPIANNRQFFEQVSGRLSRKAEGKDRARLYYIWDRHVYGIVSLINLRRWNKTVVVRREGEWVDVNDYIKEMRDGAKTK